MKPTFKVSGKGLMVKNRAMVRAAPSAAEEAAKFSARHGAGWMVANSPRDTHRFVRAWQIAMNQAGIGPVPVSKVKRSGFVERARVEQRLTRQLTFWKRAAHREMQAAAYWNTIYENRYNRVGRKGRWRDDAMMRLKKAQWRADRAAEIVRRLDEAVATVKSDPNVIIIFGKNAKVRTRDLLLNAPGGGFDNDDAKFQRRLEKAQFSLGQVTRVISKVYGGTGVVERSGTRVVVRLTNMEPHARIVEKQHRLVQRSLGVSRRAGKMIGAQFIKRVKQAKAA